MILKYYDGQNFHVVQAIPPDGEVNTAKLANLSVTTDKIAALAVTGAKIATATIQTGHLQDLAVTTAKIAANAVTSAKLAANSITASEIANNAVGTSEIAALAVTGAKIANSSIVADKIASNAVTTAKIAANAVTSAKLAANSITASEIANNAVGTSEIAALAVTGAKIANSSIVADKIASNAVTTAKIAANAVTSAKLAANSITASEIANNAVGTSEIAALAVTGAKIANSSIVADKIASNAVTTAKINNAAVTADKIAAGAVTVAKLGADVSLDPADNSITLDKLANFTNNTLIVGQGTGSNPIYRQLFTTFTTQTETFDSSSLSVPQQTPNNTVLSISNFPDDTSFLTSQSLISGTVVKTEDDLSSLRINGSIDVRNATTRVRLYYKDGSAPSSYTNGTLMNTYTSNSGTTIVDFDTEIFNVPANRYYWLITTRNNSQIDGGAVRFRSSTSTQISTQGVIDGFIIGHIQDTAPGNPSVNDLWIDTS